MYNEALQFCQPKYWPLSYKMINKGKFYGLKTCQTEGRDTGCRKKKLKDGRLRRTTPLLSEERVDHFYDCYGVC